MNGVILVRHAMPDVVRGTASKLWGLAESSREDCVLLAHAFPEPVAPTIWSSDERKARETAEVLALRLGHSVELDAGFAEVDRPEIWDRDYREVAAAYLGGSVEPGWEAPEIVAARFGSAVERALAGSGGNDIVVVNHGLAMSLWLGTRNQFDVANWWRALTLPDAWRIDLATNELEHLWMGGAAAG